MDSASNSMTPRPQAVRSSSEYHAQAGGLYHPGNGSLMRRLSSNPTELSSSLPLRRVEGTGSRRLVWNLNFCPDFFQCVCSKSIANQRPVTSNIGHSSLYPVQSNRFDWWFYKSCFC